MRFLINENGVPFATSELQAMHRRLDALDENMRKEFRNQNSSAIAMHDALKFLIVSGPGTGKSYLFLDKIHRWYQQDETANVVVTSFVRKLVADLQNDVDHCENLTRQQKSKITATTLHKFARGIVEKNHGSSKLPLKPYFGVIGQSWKNIVWKDVLAFCPNIDRNSYTWKSFEDQLHNYNFKQSENWRKLRGRYFKLCQFYNAAGFADMILRAMKALEENPVLNENDHFIIDEYQDFNQAEKALIDQLINDPEGVLVVGDDEQVLYEGLKAGNPKLIRNLYKNQDFANGMLPFCNRSSYHITKTASRFIQQHRDGNSIEKVFLPLKNCDGESKVQIIACAAPTTAVDYIEKFVADNKIAIDWRKRQLECGKAKDAFLLILTPLKEAKFYGTAKDKIKNLATEYQTESRSFSDDYYRLLSYYSLANYPANNFTFRKVFFYENISGKRVHKQVIMAMKNGIDFCDLDEQDIQDILSKCIEIKNILDSENTAGKKLNQISNLIPIKNTEKLLNEMERNSISPEGVGTLEHEEAEAAELEEIEVKKMGAIELMTMVGAKGLSADHVIITGFDDVNMGKISPNAFYVSLTRTRKSLHIITALKSRGAKRAHDYLDQLPEENTEYYKYTIKDHVKHSFRNKRRFKNYLSRLRSFS